jgi:hypothetical protein
MATIFDPQNCTRLCWYKRGNRYVGAFASAEMSRATMTGHRSPVNEANVPIACISCMFNSAIAPDKKCSCESVFPCSADRSWTPIRFKHMRLPALTEYQTSNSRSTITQAPRPGPRTEGKTLGVVFVYPVALSREEFRAGTRKSIKVYVPLTDIVPEDPKITDTLKHFISHLQP